MRDLDLLMEKLNSDQYAGVSVVDLDTNTFLFRNKTHAEIMQEYQSAENFFESLFAKGYKTLELTPKRKNGSSYKVSGASFKVNFSPNTQTTQPQSLPQIQIPEVQQPILAEPIPNSFGLGTLDIMNLMVSKNDATRLHTECEILKAENKEQKKLIDELKEERLETKYNSEKSSANQGMLLGALQHLPTLAGMLNGGASAGFAGLAGAVEQFTTPAKKTFATALQQIDDTVVSVLYNINTGLSTNNEFSVELAELLKKHNLWQS
jgi:hypothetical protein